MLTMIQLCYVGIMVTSISIYEYEYKGYRKVCKNDSERVYMNTSITMNDLKGLCCFYIKKKNISFIDLYRYIIFVIKLYIYIMCKHILCLFCNIYVFINLYFYVIIIIYDVAITKSNHDTEQL